MLQDKTHNPEEMNIFKKSTSGTLPVVEISGHCERRAHGICE